MTVGEENLRLIARVLELAKFIEEGWYVLPEEHGGDALSPTYVIPMGHGLDHVARLRMKLTGEVTLQEWSTFRGSVLTECDEQKANELLVRLDKDQERRALAKEERLIDDEARRRRTREAKENLSARLKVKGIE